MVKDLDYFNSSINNTIIKRKLMCPSSLVPPQPPPLPPPHAPPVPSQNQSIENAKFSKPYSNGYHYHNHKHMVLLDHNNNHNNDVKSSSTMNGHISGTGTKKQLMEDDLSKKQHVTRLPGNKIPKNKDGVKGVDMIDKLMQEFQHKAGIINLKQDEGGYNDNNSLDIDELETETIEGIAKSQSISSLSQCSYDQDPHDKDEGAIFSLKELDEDFTVTLVPCCTSNSPRNNLPHLTEAPVTTTTTTSKNCDNATVVKGNYCYTNREYLFSTPSPMNNNDDDEKVIKLSKHPVKTIITDTDSCCTSTISVALMREKFDLDGPVLPLNVLQNNNNISTSSSAFQRNRLMTMVSNKKSTPPNTPPLAQFFKSSAPDQTTQHFKSPPPMIKSPVNLTAAAISATLNGNSKSMENDAFDTIFMQSKESGGLRISPLNSLTVKKSSCRRNNNNKNNSIWSQQSQVALNDPATRTLVRQYEERIRNKLIIGYLPTTCGEHSRRRHQSDDVSTSPQPDDLINIQLNQPSSVNLVDNQLSRKNTKGVAATASRVNGKCNISTLSISESPTRLTMTSSLATNKDYPNYLRSIIKSSSSATSLLEKGGVLMEAQTFNKGKQGISSPRMIGRLLDEGRALKKKAINVTLARIKEERKLRHEYMITNEEQCGGEGDTQQRNVTAASNCWPTGSRIKDVALDARRSGQSTSSSSAVSAEELMEQHFLPLVDHDDDDEAVGDVTIMSRMMTAINEDECRSFVSDNGGGSSSLVLLSSPDLNNTFGRISTSEASPSSPTSSSTTSTSNNGPSFHKGNTKKSNKRGLLYSSKGTVRGVHNKVYRIVKNFIDLNLELKKKLLTSQRVVIYTTTCTALRDTYHQSEKTKALLAAMNVKFTEKDCFINVTYTKELKSLLCLEHSVLPSLPQIFIDTQHLGGFKELEQLNEAGFLHDLLERYKSGVFRPSCVECGDFNYTLCPRCHGGKRSSLFNNFSQSPLKCVHCEETGLVKCENCEKER